MSDVTYAMRHIVVAKGIDRPGYLIRRTVWGKEPEEFALTEDEAIKVRRDLAGWLDAEKAEGERDG